MPHAPSATLDQKKESSKNNNARNEMALWAL